MGSCDNSNSKNRVRFVESFYRFMEATAGILESSGKWDLHTAFLLLEERLTMSIEKFMHLAQGTRHQR